VLHRSTQTRRCHSVTCKRGGKRARLTAKKKRQWKSKDTDDAAALISAKNGTDSIGTLRSTMPPGKIGECDKNWRRYENHKEKVPPSLHKKTRLARAPRQRPPVRETSGQQGGGVRKTPLHWRQKKPNGALCNASRGEAIVGGGSSAMRRVRVSFGSCVVGGSGFGGNGGDSPSRGGGLTETSVSAPRGRHSQHQQM